jgi:hypothetical protein
MFGIVFLRFIMDKFKNSSVVTFSGIIIMLSEIRMELHLGSLKLHYIDLISQGIFSSTHVSEVMKQEPYISTCIL